MLQTQQLLLCIQYISDSHMTSHLQDFCSKRICSDFFFQVYLKTIHAIVVVSLRWPKRVDISAVQNEILHVCSLLLGHRVKTFDLRSVVHEFCTGTTKTEMNLSISICSILFSLPGSYLRATSSLLHMCKKMILSCSCHSLCCFLIRICFICQINPKFSSLCSSGKNYEPLLLPRSCNII